MSAASRGIATRGRAARRASAPEGRFERSAGVHAGTARGRARPPEASLEPIAAVDGASAAAPWIPAAPAPTPAGPRSTRRRGGLRTGVEPEGGVPAVHQACAGRARERAGCSR